MLLHKTMKLMMNLKNFLQPPNPQRGNCFNTFFGFSSWEMGLLDYNIELLT